MHRSRCMLLAALFLTIVLLPRAARAQAAGTLSGTVTDAQGGVLPGATVVALHEASGVSTQAVTRQDGRYTLSGLRPGRYRVVATMPGFRDADPREATLDDRQEHQLDFRLQIAAIAEALLTLPGWAGRMATLRQLFLVFEPMPQATTAWVRSPGENPMPTTPVHRVARGGVRSAAVHALAIAAAIATIDLAAADQWIEVKSAHFTVMSNAGEKGARKLVWQLEQVRGAMAALWSWAKPDLNKPLGVIVLKDENSMRALAPQYWEQRGAVRPGSLWVTGPDQHYLALRADVEADDQATINPYITSYFSYVGLVLDQSLDRDVPSGSAAASPASSATPSSATIASCSGR